MKKKFVLSSFEFQKYFNTDFKCLNFLEKIYYEKDGVKCGHCSSKNISKKNKKTGFYFCKNCNKRFNVRTNTIFYRSKIKLSKWFYAIYLLQTSRGGISSLQLSKQIRLRQATAWFMLHRIKKAGKEKMIKWRGGVSIFK